MSKKPCVPDDLPIKGLNWEGLAGYTSKAMQELARYDGTLNGILNPAVLLSPITLREAELSSRIEGTQATLVDVLKHEAGDKNSDDEKRKDVKEIINYRHALLTAEGYLQERPVTLQLIRELHAVLMDSVRGQDKEPGKFREEQNFIGKKGTTIEQARFVPPDPITMKHALEKLQSFIDSDYPDPLVQLAIIHAQFEIIHPFKDGNGRLGRMLIPMFLFQKHVLQRPMFYLSEYLEETDQEYRDRLLAITDDGDWQGWIEFFLKAIQVQANRNNEKAKAICGLYEHMKSQFQEVTKSQFSQSALDTFFKKPIVNSTNFREISGIDGRATAKNILDNLRAAKLIKLIRAGVGQSPSVYAMPDLINITEGRVVIENE